MSINQIVGDAFLSCRVQLARAVSRIVPPHDVEDIVQETYVRACQFEEKNVVREPGALMTTIARNLALDHIKQAGTRLKSNSDEDLEVEVARSSYSSDEPFNLVASNEEFARFCEAIRGLPTQCRKGFVLKKVYGFSQKEIAQKMGISENTVEKHIAKGMKHCVKYMLQYRENGRDSVVKPSSGTASIGDRS